MDISFNCDKCFQHIVIDEAGTGMTVQCPSCAVSLKVPQGKTTLPTPEAKPTHRELFNQCRDLAYDLRVNEANCLWKQIEKVRAEDNGYQLHEGFGFNDSASSVLEQAKWAVNEALRNLTVKEEKEIIGALVWQELTGHMEKDVSALVIGSNLQWPAFEKSFRRFKESQEWPPYLWKIDGYDDEDGPSQAEVIDFYASELTKPTDPLLARVHELSRASRRLLYGHRIQLTPDTLIEGGVALELAISELVSAGFAQRHVPEPQKKRLESFSITWLNRLHKEYGVTVPRAKKGEAPKSYQERHQKLLQPLIATIGVEKLIEILPAEEMFDITKPDIPRASFEQFRAELLAHTLPMMMASYRWFHNITNLHSEPDYISKHIKFLSGDCPFSIDAGKIVETTAAVTLEMLPPFHPGCRCCPTMY